MAKPGGDPPSGISLGDALILPKRHPACRRREAQPGSCTERENLSLRCQGRRPSGAHRKDQSTKAEHRGGAARSRDEGSVMELDRRGCVVDTAADILGTSARLDIAVLYRIPKVDISTAHLSVAKSALAEAEGRRGANPGNRILTP